MVQKKPHNSRFRSLFTDSGKNVPVKLNAFFRLWSSLTGQSLILLLENIGKVNFAEYESFYGTGVFVSLLYIKPIYMYELQNL